MIEIVFDIYGVTQKKIGLFWKHVGKHFPCLLHRLYVNYAKDTIHRQKSILKQSDIVLFCEAALCI